MSAQPRALWSTLQSFLERLGRLHAAAFLAGGLCLLAFARLTEDVLDQDLRALNVLVSQMVHATSHPVLDRIAIGLTEWGGLAGTAVVVSGVTAWLLTKKRYLDIASLWVMTIGAAVQGYLLKRVFLQPRPDLFEPVVPVQGFSYPSGHSLLSAALYLYLAAMVVSEGPGLARRWIYGALIAAVPLAVMWSRIYLGAHWVSDVVAGGLVAAFWVSSCLVLRRSFEWNQSR